VSRPTDFDELVGGDVPPGELERLRGVHDLLVQAGPPPELTPHVASGPTLAMTLVRPPRQRMVTRKVALLAAALCALSVAFLFGYLAGNSGDGLTGGRVLRLAGTSAAPNALASLRVSPSDTAGNWPMKLAGSGLPKLGPQGYYEVFLVRQGTYEPCGAFVVKNSGTPINVTLNVPYRLKPTDKWVVTREHWGDESRGTVVLRPTTT
jgi:hypothetical protein